MMKGMQRTSFSDMNCSVAQLLEVVGEWWSLLIVRDAFLGVRRFDDFQALWHVVIAMRQWGDRWAAPGGPPLKIKHTACGHVVQAVAVCSQCGERLDVHGVSAVLGPGASEGDLDHTPLSGALSGQ
jgi:hypothetical protein